MKTKKSSKINVGATQLPKELDYGAPLGSEPPINSKRPKQKTSRSILLQSKSGTKDSGTEHKKSKSEVRRHGRDQPQYSQEISLEDTTEEKILQKHSLGDEIDLDHARKYQMFSQTPGEDSLAANLRHNNEGLKKVNSTTTPPDDQIESFKQSGILSSHNKELSITNQKIFNIRTGAGANFEKASSSCQRESNSDLSDIQKSQRLSKKSTPREKSPTTVRPKRKLSKSPRKATQGSQSSKVARQEAIRQAMEARAYGFNCPDNYDIILGQIQADKENEERQREALYYLKMEEHFRNKFHRQQQKKIAYELNSPLLMMQKLKQRRRSRKKKTPSIEKGSAVPQRITSVLNPNDGYPSFCNLNVFSGKHLDASEKSAAQKALFQSRSQILRNKPSKSESKQISKQGSKEQSQQRSPLHIATSKNSIQEEQEIFIKDQGEQVDFGAIPPDMSMGDLMAEHTYVRETTNELSHSNSKQNAIYNKHSGVLRYQNEENQQEMMERQLQEMVDDHNEDLNNLFVKNIEGLHLIQESLMQSNQVSASDRKTHSFMAPIIMKTSNPSQDFTDQPHITPNNPLASYIPPTTGAGAVSGNSSHQASTTMAHQFGNRKLPSDKDALPGQINLSDHVKKKKKGAAQLKSQLRKQEQPLSVEGTSKEENQFKTRKLLNLYSSVDYFLTQKQIRQMSRPADSDQLDALDHYSSVPLIPGMNKIKQSSLNFNEGDAKYSKHMSQPSTKAALLERNLRIIKAYHEAKASKTQSAFNKKSNSVMAPPHFMFLQNTNEPSDSESATTKKQNPSFPTAPTDFKEVKIMNYNMEQAELDSSPHNRSINDGSSKETSKKTSFQVVYNNMGKSRLILKSNLADQQPRSNQPANLGQTDFSLHTSLPQSLYQSNKAKQREGNSITMKEEDRFRQTHHNHQPKTSLIPENAPYKDQLKMSVDQRRRGSLLTQNLVVKEPAIEKKPSKRERFSSSKFSSDNWQPQQKSKYFNASNRLESPYKERHLDSLNSTVVMSPSKADASYQFQTSKQAYQNIDGTINLTGGSGSGEFDKSNHDHHSFIINASYNNMALADEKGEDTDKKSGRTEGGRSERRRRDSKGQTIHYEIIEPQFEVKDVETLHSPTTKLKSNNHLLKYDTLYHKGGEGAASRNEPQASNSNQSHRISKEYTSVKSSHNSQKNFIRTVQAIRTSIKSTAVNPTIQAPQVAVTEHGKKVLLAKQEQSPTLKKNYKTKSAGGSNFPRRGRPSQPNSQVFLVDTHAAKKQEMMLNSQSIKDNDYKFHLIIHQNPLGANYSQGAFTSNQSNMPKRSIESEVIVQPPHLVPKNEDQSTLPSAPSKQGQQCLLKKNAAPLQGRMTQKQFWRKEQLNQDIIGVSNQGKKNFISRCRTQQGFQQQQKKSNFGININIKNQFDQSIPFMLDKNNYNQKPQHSIDKSMKSWKEPQGIQSGIKNQKFISLRSNPQQHASNNYSNQETIAFLNNDQGSRTFSTGFPSMQPNDQANSSLYVVRPSTLSSMNGRVPGPSFLSNQYHQSKLGQIRQAHNMKQMSVPRGITPMY